MYHDLKPWVFSMLLWTSIVHAQLITKTSLDLNAGKIKSSVFKSPAFILGPGEVQNKWYHGIAFPKGHIAIKGFDAEVVDDNGNSIPLSETYLHHWLVDRFYHKTSLTEDQTKALTKRLHSSDYISAGNDGICQPRVLSQYFGLGSETRHTSTFIPDPYGIIVGDPSEIPEGYEESWIINVHAIDTREVVDTRGCTECRCDLYNVTEDEYHRPLKKNYIGGLYCCYDGTQCKLKEGVQGEKRKLYLKYTVYWRDWEESIIPVRIYILDVTDTGERSVDQSRSHYLVGCQVEYDIAQCTAGSPSNECIDLHEAHMVIPKGGDVVYGVAHQHTGGIGSTLYGQDGQELCTSLPVYGQGREPGNETGYIVGMSTCYPEPGSLKIQGGEILKLQSKYSKEQRRTGVMGLFYLLIADPVNNVVYQDQKTVLSGGALLLAGLLIVFALIAGLGIAYFLRKRQEDDYEKLGA
uniref:Stress up-regulated Nod 19 n=1 Tax=Araucaria cunninghamii TaxID=56994 RepID=A0A0D6QS66_ARACU